jgi:precorrin-2 dehydrogenase/sirohydrochlorin ferrochelatase
VAVESSRISPVFQNLSNSNAPIVYGNVIGETARPNRPNVNVEGCPFGLHIKQNDSVKLIVKEIQYWMLRKRHMVIALHPDDLKVNKRIYDLCRKRYLICITVDTPPFMRLLFGWDSNPKENVK